MFDVVVLTKTGGLWGPIEEVLGWVMNFLFEFVSSFGIMNIGLCIILFTLVVKLIMLPLTIKQQKASKLTAVMQPEITAIQKKYKGKTDNQSMMMQNAEMKAVYEKYGTSMMGGCLPLLIQLPIMFALYRVIYNIPAYVSSVRAYFDQIIASLPSGFASSEAFTALAETHKMAGQDFSNMDKVVDLLYKLTDLQWGSLTEAFPAIANVLTETGDKVVEAINQMQQFLGMNISYTPLNIITSFFSGNGGTISVLALVSAVAIPLLSGWSQWYSSKLITANQPATEGAPGSDMMKSMNIYMPLMSVVFCFTFPVGIGIYWVASGVLQMIQQIAVNAYLKKVDIDELVKKNLEKANKKRAKKGLPPTKINGTASANLKKIQANAEKEEAERAAKLEKSKEKVKESNEYYNNDPKPGSLAAKARMVQKYNEKQNHK